MPASPWQLARQLADERGWRVRLWIDDPAPIVLLAPDQESIEVLRWTGDFATVEPGDVVIEAGAFIHCVGASQRPARRAFRSEGSPPGRVPACLFTGRPQKSALVIRRLSAIP